MIGDHEWYLEWKARHLGAYKAAEKTSELAFNWPSPSSASASRAEASVPDPDKPIRIRYLDGSVWTPPTGQKLPDEDEHEFLTRMLVEQAFAEADEAWEGSEGFGIDSTGVAAEKEQEQRGSGALVEQRKKEQAVSSEESAGQRALNALREAEDLRDEILATARELGTLVGAVGNTLMKMATSDDA